MAQRDSGAQFIKVTPRQALSLIVVRVATVAAAEALHAGRYPPPTGAQFTAIASAISQAAEVLPHLVNMAEATDQQLEAAAEALGALAVIEILGKPPVVS